MSYDNIYILNVFVFFIDHFEANLGFISHYFDNSSNFFFDVKFLLLPEIFLILAIFLYLCLIKNFNSFYISSLFFYFILFVELLLLVHN